MIDVENQVFTKVASELRTSFPGITVVSRTTFMPDAFPCACIEEADNNSFRKTRDTSSNEKFAEIMYEVNVYSNKKEGAKTECKNIFSVIDTKMESMGFTRTGKNPVPVDEPMTYRLVGRYSAIVSQNQTIYRR